MNRLEGTIAFARGSGAIRLVGLDTPSGRIQALVLDTGSSDRAYAEGRKAAGLFKETSVVFHASPGSSLAGKVVSIQSGDVLVALEVALDPTGTRLRAHLPVEELPGPLAVGDVVRLHVPASAVALELR